MHTTSFESPDTGANGFCLTMSLKHFKGIFSVIKEHSFQYCLCSKGAISNRYSCISEVISASMLEILFHGSKLKDLFY